MKGKVVGIIIFAVVVIAAVLITLLTGDNSLSLGNNNITVSGYVGGEKIGFLSDERVVEILKKRYGITVDYTKAGSIEMVDYDTTDADFLFPSSQTAYEIYKNKYGSQGYKSEKVFYSPIVFYSWDTVVQGLIQNGLVTEQDGGYYTTELADLIPILQSETAWSDLGVDIYGNFKIISTDPNKSNSGTMYSALLTNMLGGGTVADEETVAQVSPYVKAIFTKLGQMESSSGSLYTRYLNLGMGESPMIVGYENQIIEFAISNSDIWANVKDTVALIYPEPTVWSEHYFIALTEGGQQLLEALKDEELQQIAWESHGFRTSSTAYGIDDETVGTLRIQETINKVISVPDAQSMIDLLNYLESDQPAVTPEGNEENTTEE